MSVNYFNSAGTDLDNLFYINNGNAGAVGFVEASGQDLGNRYTNASTLGYSVGYVNSAGTDLGYLRGNTVPPSISNYWANNTTQKNSSSDINVYNDYGDSGTEYDHTSHTRTVSAYFNAGCNCSGTEPLYWQLCVCMITGSSALAATFAYWDNNTSSHKNYSGSTAHFENKSLSANSESDWFTIYNSTGGTAPWRNVAIWIDAGFDNTTMGSQNVSYGIRVYQRVYSAYGDTGWRHNDIWFG